MKKYMLYTGKDTITDSFNAVYEYVETKSLTGTLLKCLKVIHTTGNKTFDIGNTIHLGTDNLTDVTSVYLKIQNLYGLACNKKLDFVIGNNLLHIKTKFENGEYPTKEDFLLMKKIWNKAGKPQDVIRATIPVDELK